MKVAVNPAGPADYYTVPDPEFAYLLSLSHGTEAVAGRWPAFSWKTISTWISVGRLRATGKPGRVRRSAEERQRIVNAVFEHGSPTAAAHALGMDRRVVGAILQRAGVTDYPRTSFRENGKRTRRALSSNPRPKERLPCATPSSHSCSATTPVSA